MEPFLTEILFLGYAVCMYDFLFDMFTSNNILYQVHELCVITLTYRTHGFEGRVKCIYDIFALLALK